MATSNQQPPAPQQPVKDPTSLQGSVQQKFTQPRLNIGGRVLLVARITLISAAWNKDQVEAEAEFVSVAVFLLLPLFLYRLFLVSAVIFMRSLAIV